MAFSGYDGDAAVQPESCIRMMQVMYLWIPLVISLVITIILSRMNVEEANERLKKEKNTVI